MNYPTLIDASAVQARLELISGTPGLMQNFHWHKEVEVNFVVHGAMKYLFGGSAIEVPENHLAIFWATIPHRVVRLAESTSYYCLYVPLTNILQWQLPNAFTQSLLRGDVVLEPDTNQAAFDLTLFARWKQDFADLDPETEQIILLELEARLRRLARTALTEPTQRTVKKKSKMAAMSVSNTEMDKVEQMAFYVSEHYGDPVTVADIAEAVSLHPKYAMTLFRKNCGITLLDYLTQHRLSQAQRLLATTDAKIVDIAFEAGFGSVSRFYEVFERSCGKSPRDYRRSFFPNQ